MVFEASAGFKLRLSVETITPPQASPRHLTVLLCPGGGNLASVVVIWVGHLTPYGSDRETHLGHNESSKRVFEGEIFLCHYTFLSCMSRR